MYDKRGLKYKRPKQNKSHGTESLLCRIGLFWMGSDRLSN